ncbi:MAG TPA: hypothetical protein VK436_05450 [Methanocella sp.]|nr:hypothetical protein [Methanocella sp.]
MIELPEASVIAGQATDTICGKKILKVVAAQSPHKFAWYHRNPQDYDYLLTGRVLEKAAGLGSMVGIRAGDAIILFAEGVGLRYHGANDGRPKSTSC